MPIVKIVRGSYVQDIEWKVPAGIDLTDTETYSFGDKWGILYITNKKTGQEWEIDAYHESEPDKKRADELHLTDGEEDTDDEEDKPECFGKHCAETDSLKKYQCFNRYYINDADMIQEKLLCDHCAALDGNVHKKCRGCSNSYPYAQLQLHGGPGFVKRFPGEKEWFCNPCIEWINERSWYVEEDD
jgi:hypothetical protein